MGNGNWASAPNYANTVLTRYNAMRTFNGLAPVPQPVPPTTTTTSTTSPDALHHGEPVTDTSDVGAPAVLGPRADVDDRAAAALGAARRPVRRTLHRLLADDVPVHGGDRHARPSGVAAVASGAPAHDDRAPLGPAAHHRPALLPPHDGDLVVCGSNGGGPRDPHWADNVRAERRVWIRVDGRLRPADAHVAEGDERAAVFTVVAAQHGGLARYQRQASKHGRDVPLVVLPRT